MPMTGNLFQNNILIYCKKLYFVLGGGIAEGQSLPSHVQSRCDFVISDASIEDYVLTSSSFSLNVPPHLDKDRFIISEASLMGKYLKNNSIKCSVGAEQQSHDTFGAFFFLFSLYLEIINFEKLVVVTSDFHLKRCEIIFEHLNEHWNKKNVTNISKYELISIPSFENTEISSRIQYEKQASISMKKRLKTLKNWLDISSYVLTKHTNYSLQYSGRKLKNKQGY
jgi:hypothetical protein